MSTRTETFLRLSTTIAADPEAVFRACIEPERMKHWMAPEGFQVAELEADVRVGGRYRIRMKGPEGSFHTAVGEYREVESPSRLVFTWDWEEEGMRMGDTRVTMEFRDAGEGRTEVVLVHDLFPSADAVENHEKGWTSCLDRLEALVG